MGSRLGQRAMDLMRRIRDRSGVKLGLDETAEIYLAVFQEISDALARGERVDIRGFGSFRRAQGRSSIHFKSSSRLRDRVGLPDAGEKV